MPSRFTEVGLETPPDAASTLEALRAWAAERLRLDETLQSAPNLSAWAAGDLPDFTDAAVQEQIPTAVALACGAAAVLLVLLRECYIGWRTRRLLHTYGHAHAD